MPEIEYNTGAFFQLDIDQVADLTIKKISGITLEMKVAAGSGAIGTMKDGRTQTQATPGGVTQSSIKVEIPSGNEGPQNKLTEWYNDCHATSRSGGATKSRSLRYTATLFVLDGNGNVGAEYQLLDVFPSNLTHTGEMSVGKAGEISQDILELECTQMIRKL